MKIIQKRVIHTKLDMYILYISEGVQLLCLIEKGLDACRYLQTYNQWDQAVWLAKVCYVLF